MTWLQKLALATAILVLTNAASYWRGSDSVYQEWEKDKAVRAALLKAEKDRATATVASLTEEFKRKMEYAKTKAASDAITEYLRSIGVLHTGKDIGKASVPERTLATSCESVSTERARQFAERCVEDARRVVMCRQWAIDLKLPTK